MNNSLPIRRYYDSDIFNKIKITAHIPILSDEHKPKNKEKEKNHGRKETQKTCTLLGKISQEI